MGAMFIGQQFLQNVLGYSTLEAGAGDPARRGLDGARSRRGRRSSSRRTGARFTLLVGYVFCFLGFLTMLLLWREGIPYWKVGLGYAFVGIGVGFAGTPASHSLTGSVPVQRAGMASGTADLQRDLGGAIMQSILGALLTAGYASAVTKLIAGRRTRRRITDSMQSELTKSFSSAADLATAVPAVRQQIIAGAKQSFVDGQDWAYIAGIVADPARRGARVLPVPEARPRGRAARPLPRRGPRARRAATRAAGHAGTPRRHPRRRPGLATPRHPTFHRWTRTPLDRTATGRLSYVPRHRTVAKDTLSGGRACTRERWLRRPRWCRC